MDEETLPAGQAAWSSAQSVRGWGCAGAVVVVGEVKGAGAAAASPCELADCHLADASDVVAPEGIFHLFDVGE